MDVFEPVIRKYLEEVIDGAKAEIQRFADALEAWLGELWDHMPRDGWREDLDGFVEHWAAQGIVAEPDDIRDLKVWIAGYEQHAIARQRAPKPPPASAVVTPLPPDVARAAQYAQLVEYLQFFGQWIMAREPPDRWLAEAEKIVQRFAIPPDLAARFLAWIADEQQRGMAGFQLRNAGPRYQAPREETFVDLLLELAAGMDEFLATNSPERMFKALRKLIQGFPKALPDSLKGPDFEFAIRLIQEVFSEWLDFLEALPPEAFGLLLDFQQLMLDILGMIPGFGEPIDAISAIISLGRREYVDFGLSVLSTAPVLGMITGGGKIFKRLARLKGLAAKLDGPVRRVLDGLLAFLFTEAPRLRPTLDSIAQFFRRLREQIRELTAKLKGKVLRAVPSKPPLPPPQSQTRYRWSGHRTAALAEEELARTVHNLPDQAVVRWGDPIGTHGADVISVNIRTGEVTLWDSKFRSGSATVQPSKTFGKANSLDNAILEATETISANTTLPANIRDAALKNLEQQKVTTRTVGAGNARNSTLK